MHTVIILNKQSSDLLKDFRFLYKPFVDEGTISFCDWNEAGTDLKSAVPDIYKCTNDPFVTYVVRISCCNSEKF